MGCSALWHMKDSCCIRHRAITANIGMYGQSMLCVNCAQNIWHAAVSFPQIITVIPLLARELHRHSTDGFLLSQEAPEQENVLFSTLPGRH